MLKIKVIATCSLVNHLWIVLNNIIS